MTMKYVERSKLGAFTNETTHRIHGTDVGGNKLPTFQDWIVQKHGHLYWCTHYDKMYEAYSADVFREYQVNDGSYIMANSHIAEAEHQRYGLYTGFQGRENTGVSSGEVAMEARDMLEGREWDGGIESEDRNEQMINQENAGGTEIGDIVEQRESSQDMVGASPSGGDNLGGEEMTECGGINEGETRREIQSEEGGTNGELEEWEGWPSWKRRGIMKT